MYPPSENCIPLFSFHHQSKKCFHVRGTKCACDHNAIDLHAATMVVSVYVCDELKGKNPEKKFGMAVDVRFLI